MSLFTEKKIFVKEQVRFMKYGNVFEFFTPDNKKLGEAREEEIEGIMKVLKLTKYKPYLPFTISIYDKAGEKLVTIRRGFSFLLSTVRVFDTEGRPIGHYKQRFRFFKSKFNMFDEHNKHFADMTSVLLSWTHTITDLQGIILCRASKKFSGIGKELFTTADNYLVEMEHTSHLSKNQLRMILSVACVIDMIAGERS